jgi:pSer/pThr/pTyr-binding forkhead associated (FHA) protein
MIRLEINGRQYPVSTEWLVLGSADDCSIRLTDEGVLPRHALVKAASDGSVAVQVGDPSAEVHVNGVKLGADPTPVLHGDKITVGSQEILVVEAANVGSTQHIKVGDLAGLGEPVGREVPVPLNPLTGGRLVCLTDGREYIVGEQGMFFGRDAVSDIVVTSGKVSRRHAQILPTPQGYVLNDSSTNGTFVNEERVEGSRVLIRADVLRIGDDEFRFYAEESQPAAPPEPEPTPAPVVTAAPPRPPVAPRASTPPPGAAARLNNTMMGMPAFDPASLTSNVAGAAGTILATLLVRKGLLKGERFTVKVPVANIGRADYNDIVVDHESVSQAHAKLQLRDEVWVLSDVGSTNGTTVDGVRVEDEIPLSPGSTITIGEVPMLFDPREGLAVHGQPETAVVPALGSVPPPARRATPAEVGAAPKSSVPKVVASPRKSGSGRWLLIVLVIAATAVAALYILGGR